jgi:hypothetical protein
VPPRSINPYTLATLQVLHALLPTPYYQRSRPHCHPFAEQVNYTGESLHIPSWVPTSMATIPASRFTHVLCGKVGLTIR